jgi:DNA ligase-1
MRYADVVAAYQTIEATTSRRQMRDALVALLAAAPPALLPRLVYLTQGRLYPDFEGVEIGLAERLARRAVAAATGQSEEKVAADLAHSGDLGTTAEHLLSGDGHGPPLTVDDVYEGLDTIARSSGAGSVAAKVETLAALLRGATPAEARYLVRTATGQLRLGLGDMTILDALAVAWGGSAQARPAIERAYNLSSDLGEVAERLADGGLEAMRRFQPEPFHPVRPMLAERLRSPEEIMARFGGRCAAEIKYDGERLQIHKRGHEVEIFSRRLEQITAQYPDAVDLARQHLRAESAIVEAEAVARDPGTDELLPFQELMRRKRKHGVAEAAAALPVSLMIFDLLYVDGEDFTTRDYSERRARLAEIVAEGPRVKLTEQQIVASVPALEAAFDRAIAAGTEGLVCKSLAPDAVYQAGSRGWLWIKLKREAISTMIDTVDLVVVGAFYGRGRRAGAYGSLLLAAYDPEADMFRTVTRCGTGFKDEELAALPARLAPYALSHPHPRVDAKLMADVWFTPALVVEIAGAELTLSPTHTADWNAVRKGSGLAIRFPRFTGRWRDDKAPEDATTTAELLELYLQQGSRLKLS